MGKATARGWQLDLCVVVALGKIEMLLSRKGSQKILKSSQKSSQKTIKSSEKSKEKNQKSKEKTNHPNTFKQIQALLFTFQLLQEPV